IKANTFAFNKLKDCKLIIWDEITMTPYIALDEVNRLLKEICNNSLRFGGKVIVIGGDFRQTLPIVKHGHRVKVVEMCVKSSAIWRSFQQIKLHENMRVL